MSVTYTRRTTTVRVSGSRLTPEIIKTAFASRSINRVKSTRHIEHDRPGQCYAADIEQYPVDGMWNAACNTGRDSLRVSSPRSPRATQRMTQRDTQRDVKHETPRDTQRATQRDTQRATQRAYIEEEEDDSDQQHPVNVPPLQLPTSERGDLTIRADAAAEELIRAQKEHRRNMLELQRIQAEQAALATSRKLKEAEATARMTQTHRNAVRSQRASQASQRASQA